MSRNENSTSSATSGYNDIACSPLCRCSPCSLFPSTFHALSDPTVLQDGLRGPWGSSTCKSQKRHLHFPGESISGFSCSMAITLTNPPAKRHLKTSCRVSSLPFTTSTTASSHLELGSAWALKESATARKIYPIHDCGLPYVFWGTDPEDECVALCISGGIGVHGASNEPRHSQYTRTGRHMVSSNFILT